MRLIDANQLTAKLKQFFPKSIQDGITFRTGFKQILTDIENEPRIDAVPVVHGHWQMYRTYYRCSNCLCQDAIGLAPYCKNCGSKMDNGVS